MEDLITNHNFTFIAPSGASYTIREQNGGDDDILSNPTTARNLMNLSNFISAIVVDQNFYNHGGRISPEEALKLSSNDRYAILLNSRIHSIGEILEFSHKWEDNQVTEYEVDLREFLFNKEVNEITEEDFKSKPEAIPLYPNGRQTRDIETYIGDKHLMFDVLNGEGEQYVLTLTEDQRTKNKELIARNLRMEVKGNWEKVTNFSMFSLKEMSQLRKTVFTYDPVFSGNVTIQHPNGQYNDFVNIMAIPGFFWPEEID